MPVLLVNTKECRPLPPLQIQGQCEDVLNQSASSSCETDVVTKASIQAGAAVNSVLAAYWYDAGGG